LFRRSRVFAWPLLSAVALPERTSSAQSSSAPQNPSRLAAGAATIGRPGLSTAGATAATVRLTPKSDPGPRHYRQQRGAKSRWRAGVTTRAYCCWSACELASHRISCTLGREKRPAVAQLELMFKLAAASRRSTRFQAPTAVAQHALPRNRSGAQSDRPWAPDDGKRDLAQLRALDPMPVLGGAGVVSSILNCILKLTSASPNADIFSRSVLRAAELDQRGHKRAVDAHHLLCLAVAMRVRAAGRLRHRRHAHRRGRSDALPSVGAEYPERRWASPRAREAAAGQAQI
jgi:hypothetical protein